MLLHWGDFQKQFDCVFYHGTFCMIQLCFICSVVHVIESTVALNAFELLSKPNFIALDAK